MRLVETIRYVDCDEESIEVWVALGCINLVEAQRRRLVGGNEVIRGEFWLGMVRSLAASEARVLNENRIPAQPRREDDENERTG
jgi:hypothetical protein